MSSSVSAIVTGNKTTATLLNELKAFSLPMHRTASPFSVKNRLRFSTAPFETGCNLAQPQPYRLAPRDWMTWDGRLDNRNDLIRSSLSLTTHSPDVEIVASTYERLGTGLFSQLIGDWAISIFSDDRRKSCWPEIS